MKRRLLAVVLALVMVASFAIAGTSSAATKAYGTVYAKSQPVYFDWSSYSSYGYEFKAYITDLKTNQVVYLRGNAAPYRTYYTYGSYVGYSNESNMVTVEVYDSHGMLTKTARDFFHFGAVVVKPQFTSTEKIAMRGVLLKDAKKYPAFTDKCVIATNEIVSFNPFFANNNCNGNWDLWFNRLENWNMAIDSNSVVRSGYASSKYSYDYKAEADIFRAINKYREQERRASFVWSDRLGMFGRLRATAASDNLIVDDTYDVSEISDGTLLTDLKRYGWAPNSNSTEFLLTKSIDWTADGIVEQLKEIPVYNDIMLGNYRVLTVGVVRVKNLLGSKKSGIAIMFEFAN